MSNELPRAKLDINAWALAILLIPFLVLTASELLLGIWGDSGLTVDAEVLKGAPLVELASRYLVFAAFFFFVTICVAVTAIFGVDLSARFSRLAQIKTFIALLAAIGATLIYSVIEPEAMNSFESYQLLGEDLVRQALATAKTGACLPDRESCEVGTGFDALVRLVDLSNYFISVAAAVLTGIILALGDLPDRDADTASMIQALSASRRVAQRYLYCAGVLLTAGMIWVQAWMQWPTQLITDSVVQDQFKAMVSSLSLFRGTTYSALILSVYLPVLLCLTLRTEKLRKGSGEVEKESIRSTIATANYTDALKSFVAIVSPILAGAVGSGWTVAFGG